MKLAPFWDMKDRDWAHWGDCGNCADVVVGLERQL